MFTDRFGREFVVGARVVYGVRVGNTGELVDGVITKIVPVQVYRWVNNQRTLTDWFKLQISAPERYRRDAKMKVRTLWKVEHCVVVP